MGIFRKYKEKVKIGTSGLVLAKYDAGGFALIKNGRVIEDNIRSISRNVYSNQENDNDEVFYVRTSDGDFKIYNIKNGGLVVNSLKRNQTDEVKIKEDGESFIVDFGECKWIVNTQGLAISEDYRYIGENNNYAIRKVEKLHGGIDGCYYVDIKAQKVSPDFILDKDAGEKHKILRLINNENQYKEVIWSQDGSFKSREFDKVEYKKGRFFVDDNGRKYFVNSIGDRQTGDIESCQILTNGIVIAKEKGSLLYSVYDKTYGAFLYLKKPIVDAEAGIVVGETVNGKTVMMGLDASKVYTVDSMVSRMIMSKLAKNRMSPEMARKVIQNSIDIMPTLNVYLRIVTENLRQDKNNKVLKWLDQNAKEEVVGALNNYTEKIYRASSDDKEKLNIFFKPNIVKEWQASLKKKNQEYNEYEQ